MLTLLWVFLHHENGDFSIFMKDIPFYWNFGFYILDFWILEFWNFDFALNNGNVSSQW
jgi:hypothetical protein